MYHMGELKRQEEPDSTEGTVGSGRSLSDFHMKLYRAFHAQRDCLRPFAASLGLGSGQPKLLSYIAAHGFCTQRELAAFFEIDPSAVCRMLDSLEREGFIVCTRATDRRTKLMELTNRGRDAIDAWDKRCAEVEAAMLDGFAPEERDLLANYLERVQMNLRSLVSRERADAHE
jgi:DNA-binding MarR family transcriptional regulator